MLHLCVNCVQLLTELPTYLNTIMVHAETEQLVFHSTCDPLSLEISISFASHIVMATAGTSQPLLPCEHTCTFMDI